MLPSSRLWPAVSQSATTMFLIKELNNMPNVVCILACPTSHSFQDLAQLDNKGIHEFKQEYQCDMKNDGSRLLEERLELKVRVLHCYQ